MSIYSNKSLLFKALVWVLIITLLQACPAQARLFRRIKKHPASPDSVIYTPADTLSPASRRKSPAVQSVMPSTEEDELIQDLADLVWEPMLPEAKKMSLKETLKHTEEENTDILLSREKAQETRAKEKGVENKRLLFFFKFFNAEYLEGSAGDDIQADDEHVDVETHKALLESCHHYYDLIRAVMNHYIAYQSIRQGLKQLDFNKARFTSGETTSVDVMQTKTELIRRYQNYLQSQTLYRGASIALSQQLNLPSDRWIYPSDLKFKDDRFLLPVLNLLPDSLEADKAIKIAFKNRPELKELAFRQTSLEKLVKASSLEIDKSQQKILESSLRQLNLKIKAAQQNIEAASRRACENYQLAQDKMALSLKELEMAETALKQVQISHKAGFNSNKDVLDAQVSFAQAQVNHTDAVIDYNLSQIQLLYEIGLIRTDILLQEKILTI